MTGPVELIGQVPAGAAYGILAAGILVESVLLLGAFVPTLTLLLAAGALARAGELDLGLVVVTASCAVVAGDALGHRTGRLLGGRLLGGRLGRRVPSAAWRRAEAFMARHGGRAVFFCRFVPVMRTLAPHLAGASRLPYRRIAPSSAMAAPLWAGAESGAGYAAATSLQHASAFGGPALAAAAVLAVGAGASIRTVRRRSRGRRAATTATPAAAGLGGHPGAARGGAPRPPLPWPYGGGADAVVRVPGPRDGARRCRHEVGRLTDRPGSGRLGPRSP